MRISDWSSDVCSSDLLRSSGESLRHHCAARPSCSALLRGNAMIVHLPHRTDRLLLRTLRLSDVEAFHGYRSREDVARLQGWSPMSREQALEFLRGEATDASLSPGAWRQIGIAMHDDFLVGDIGIQLSADLRVAEFGLSIDPRRQGRGLGTEAVQARVLLLLDRKSTRLNSSH